MHAETSLVFVMFANDTYSNVLGAVGFRIFMLPTAFMILNTNVYAVFIFYFEIILQATEGPCGIPKPGFFDFQGKQKW